MVTSRMIIGSKKTERDHVILNLNQVWGSHFQGASSVVVIEGQGWDPTGVQAQTMVQTKVFPWRGMQANL